MSGAAQPPADRGVPIGLSADDLLAETRRITGIDIIDEDAREPLTVLLHSLDTESFLHAEGAAGWRDYLRRALSNRLRMRRDIAAHPEILDQPINQPVFMVGLGRSGTTKMLQLLSASGDYNWCSLWRVMNPSLLTGDRNEPVAPRIDDIARWCTWFDRLSPETKTGHIFLAEEAEEESFILMHSLVSPVLLGWSPIPGYQRWLAGQDMSIQFRYLRETLQYLQWQGLATAAKPWILKCPLYPGMEGEILAAFPDARLVMTHRDPQAAVPSSMKLLSLFHQPWTQASSDYAAYLAGIGAMMDRHVENRATIPGFAILDIPFHDVTTHIEQVIERVYAWSGLTLTPAARDRMLAWNRDNPQHRHGRYHYDVADYGLTRADIAHAFARYLAFLKTLFPGETSDP